MNLGMLMQKQINVHIEMSAKSGINDKQMFIVVSSYLLKDKVMDKFELSDTNALNSMLAFDGDLMNQQIKSLVYVNFVS